MYTIPKYSKQDRNILKHMHSVFSSTCTLSVNAKPNKSDLELQQIMQDRHMHTLPHTIRLAQPDPISHKLEKGQAHDGENGSGKARLIATHCMQPPQQSFSP